MLKNLLIQNLAIIDELDIDFESGLNVLTGETGAGKSILLQAIKTVLGGKVEGRMVQAGKDSCQVIATFQLKTMEDELVNFLSTQEVAVDKKNPEFILRRVVKKDGKHKCWLNDEVVTLGILQQLAGFLMEMEAQGESHRLMNIESHRDLLDDYGGHDNMLADVATAYQEWQALLTEEKKLAGAIEKNKADREEWQAMKKELEDIHLQDGEVAMLEEKRKAIQGAEKNISALNEMLEFFDDRKGIKSEGLRLHKLLMRYGGGEVLTKATDAMDDALNNLTAVADEIEAQLKTINEPEWSLEEIEERLFALKDLARKYRRPVEMLPDLLREVEENLASEKAQGEEMKKLQEKVAKQEQQYQKLAQALTQKRKQSAESLTAQVMKVLPDLKLPHAVFHIEFLAESKPTGKGLEKVQFLCQTNPGQHKDLLHKIASGGELARFLLAIEQAIGAGVDCLIFDEVDSGVGGATADAVGRLLLSLSKTQQCLVITHSPQVAAIGRHHYQVEKTVKSEKVETKIKRLDGEERVKEIARMLSAEEITAEAMAQAKKLLAG